MQNVRQINHLRRKLEAELLNQPHTANSNPGVAQFH